MRNILYCYGTLRPGKYDPVHIPGKLYDLGWYPGIKLGFGPETVICEPIPLTDVAQFDGYEGYDPLDPDRSLYIRQPLLVPYGIDGWIYEYNRPVMEMNVIEGGDWLEHTKTKRGSHGANI
jgi:gamma-glutamylcyclotransferase (GGCT)/AIG2-like uncharacterized protein YtfP